MKRIFSINVNGSRAPDIVEFTQTGLDPIEYGK